MDQLRNAQCVAVACLTLAAKLDGPEAVDNVERFQVSHPSDRVHIGLPQAVAATVLSCVTRQQALVTTSKLRLIGATPLTQVDTEIWSTSFSAGQIRGMELMICSTLDWRLHCATPADFLDCLLCLANVGRRPDGTLLAGGRPAARVRSMAHTLIFQMLAGDWRRTSGLCHQ
jgi:Cyclin, N-terminal domain